MGRKLLFVDIETRGLEAAYSTECPIVLVGVLGAGIKKVLAPKNLSDFLWSVAKTHTLVFHNAAFDMAVIRTHCGEKLYDELKFHDTMLMAYCLDTSWPSYSLDALAERFLGRKKVKVKDFRTADTALLARRVVGDIELTRSIYYELRDELIEDELAWDEYRKVELPYVRRIIEMQSNGAVINVPQLEYTERLLRRYSRMLDRAISKQFYAFKGKHWKGNTPYVYMMPQGVWFESSYSNIKGEKRWEHCELDVWNQNSPQQVCEVLKHLYPRTDFGFRKTKDGKDTVKAEELIELAEVHNKPLLRLLASQSKTAHYISSFVEPMKAYMRDGSIYASFNQCVTRTGRLSSSKPNLQNIPRKGKVGSLFRSCFTADHPYTVVVGDLDRIELVVLAHYLEEYGYSTYMADAVRAGEDLHQANCDAWKCERDQAKKGIFTLVYGASDDKFASTMGVSVERAREVKAKIQESTGLFDFRESVIRRCRANGGVLHDLFGRRLIVPEVLSSKQEVRSMGERKIGNYIVQSTAGTIFKILQNRAAKAIKAEPYDAHLCIVVHDEALYKVYYPQVEATLALLNHCFQDNKLLNVPISAEFHAGANWKEAK